MAVNTQRILRDASDVAEDIVARSKKFYGDTVDRLPEGSERYVPIAAGGIALITAAFILGRRSRPMRRPLEARVKDITSIDFKPVYRLARLWLIARLAR